MTGDDLIGEHGLSCEDLGAIVIEAIEGMEKKGVNHIVVVASASDDTGSFAYHAFRGGFYTALGLMETSRARMIEEHIHPEEDR